MAERLKVKVYVDSRRYRILSSLEWPKERMQIFTTDKSETSLWVVPLGSVNMKQMRDYLEEGNKNKVFAAPYSRVVGFRPTGELFFAIANWIGLRIIKVLNVFHPSYPRLDLLFTICARQKAEDTSLWWSTKAGQKSH